MSNNLAIQGFIKAHPGCYVITSMIEHDDIYLILEDYPQDLVYYVPCDNNGILDIDYLEQKLIELSNTDSSILVSIQWANNEMGVIQDMRQISEVVYTFPTAYLHTDATQMIPHYPISLDRIYIDMLSCSSQKIGGLKGTGLLYVRNGVHICPIIYGDQGVIGGTENVPGIVCMAEAFKNIDYSYSTIVSTKRDYLYSKLKDCGTLVGTLENRLPNNLNMIFDGIRGEELQCLLSEFGICVSTGSACSSHTDTPSRTLTAMGYSKDQANSSIRFSLGTDVSYDDLDYVSMCVHKFVEELRSE